MEYTQHGVIGILPEISLISWGTHSSYVALMKKADDMGADDVVNIKTDLIRSSYLGIYTNRTWVATGIAVEYKEIKLITKVLDIVNYGWMYNGAPLN